jgi:polysaccharide chain length determinant protein (PEP-CTERM system associated)
MATSQVENETSLKETCSDMLDVFARRRWWVLCTSCVVALATLLVVRQLPDRYASEAVLARHQPVSQGYALGAPTILTNDEAVETIKREVLSRPRLIAIVKQFGLYTNPRAKGATAERLVQAMRREITIEPLDPVKLANESSSFKISFTADNPKVAQSVVDQLVQIFIDANVKTRENRAEETTTFLRAQVDAAREKLSQQEQRVHEFKAQYAGELPEQQQGNSVAATELQTQLQNTLNSLDRVKQQRAAQEASLAGTLMRRRAERATLLGRYTPRHPEVLKKEQEIATMEAVLRRLRGDSTAGGNPQSLATPDDPVLAEVVRQAETSGREFESLTREAARLRSTVGQYQGRLNMAPLREQQLSGLLRDYDLSKQEYTALLNRQLQAELAGNLEERGEGVQFRLVDPPTLPLGPNSPPRIPICLGGAAAGVLLGLGLAFLLHFLDGSLKSEKSAKQRFALPIVLGIPPMRTVAEERRLIWRRRFEWVTACAMTLAVVVAEVYVLRQS